MIEDIQPSFSGHEVMFTHRDRSDFTATIDLTADDLKQILNRLSHDAQDAIIVDVEKRRAKEAVAELLANRKADRQDAANRRREMRQEMRDSYAR